MSLSGALIVGRPRFGPRLSRCALGSPRGSTNGETPLITDLSGYLKAVWPDFWDSFLRSRRPRGPWKASQNVGGAKAPAFLRALPGSRGRPDFKNAPQRIRPDCLQVPRLLCRKSPLKMGGTPLFHGLLWPQGQLSTGFPREWSLCVRIWAGRGNQIPETCFKTGSAVNQSPNNAQNMPPTIAWLHFGRG